MNPSEVFLRQLRIRAAGCRLVLVDDPHGLLTLPAEIRTKDDLEPLHVITAGGNLTFRWRYEPWRDRDARLLIVRRRAEIVAPDLDARLTDRDLRLTVTAARLLAWATGDSGWRDWVDGEADLVREHGAAVVAAHRRFRHVSDTPLDDGDLERLLLWGALGWDLDEPLDAADAWSAISRVLPTLTALRARGSRLAARLTAWLRRQPAPVCWIDPAEPQTAVRLVWLVALLLPHLDELDTLLPRLYPGARRLAGEDATAIARVAYRLARHDPTLARQQAAAAEQVLAGPLRESLVRLLNLRDPAACAELLRRESRSGLLVLMALRTLLAAVAGIGPAAPPGLEPILAGLARRVDGLTLGDEVEAHRRLLADCLRCEAIRRRLAEAEPRDPAALARLFIDAEVDALEPAAAAAREALWHNALGVLEYDPQPEAERHKAVMAALFHLTELADQAVAGIDETAAGLLADQPGPAGIDRSTDVLAHRVEPALVEAGVERASVVLVAGLPWHAWRAELAGPLQQTYDLEVSPLLAPLPTAGERLLHEALMEGGPVPRRGALPQPLRPLREAGLLVWWGSSRARLVAAVDLLAGTAGGLEPALHAGRVALLRDALLAVAASGRRDQRVVLLTVSGAVVCDAAAGLALPGQAYGARGIVTAPAPGLPSRALRLNPADWNLPGPDGALLLVASDRSRLAPCAPGVRVADGGASLAERVVPLAIMTRLPGGEAATLTVGELIAPAEAAAGEPVELGVWVTLTGGALSELATLTPLEPAGEPVSVTLDLDEPRWLATTVAAPAGTGPHGLTARLTVGRRAFTRRATLLARRQEATRATANGRGPEDRPDDA